MYTVYNNLYILCIKYMYICTINDIIIRSILYYYIKIIKHSISYKRIHVTSLIYHSPINWRNPQNGCTLYLHLWPRAKNPPPTCLVAIVVLFDRNQYRSQEIKKWWKCDARLLYEHLSQWWRPAKPFANSVAWAQKWLRAMRISYGLPATTA